MGEKEKPMTEQLADEATKAGAEVLNVAGGKDLRGTIQALFFTVPVGSLTVILVSFDENMITPLILILGAMAVAISVQQLYLFGASHNKAAKLAYFWGASSLITFGLAGMITALSQRMIVPTGTYPWIEYLPLPLMCLGFVCLYRFIVLYLQKDLPNKVTQANVITIFTNSAPVFRVIDFLLFILAVLYIVLVLFHGVIPAFKAEYFQQNQLLLAHVEVRSFFAFNLATASAAILFLVFSYAISLTFYLKRISGLNADDELFGTIRFFQAMAKAFYLPTLAQAVYLVSLLSSPITQDTTSGELVFPEGPTVLLALVGIVYVGVPVVFALFVQRKEQQSICISMLFVMAPIGIYCMTWQSAFATVPMPFMTLGLLTLGFAYLPARDLLRLREQT